MASGHCGETSARDVVGGAVYGSARRCRRWCVVAASCTRGVVPGGSGASSPLGTRAASFADRGASVMNLGVVECLWVGLKRKLK